MKGGGQGEWKSNDGNIGKMLGKMALFDFLAHLGAKVLTFTHNPANIYWCYWCSCASFETAVYECHTFYISRKAKYERNSLLLFAFICLHSQKKFTMYMVLCVWTLSGKKLSLVSQHFLKLMNVCSQAMGSSLQREEPPHDSRWRAFRFTNVWRLFTLWVCLDSL